MQAIGEQLQYRFAFDKNAWTRACGGASRTATPLRQGISDRFVHSCECLPGQGRFDAQVNSQANGGSSG
jgi:hypothetical protein